MKDFASRVQRELPDTDKNRYDVAYERGKAQSRSTLMFGGLMIGSAIGAGLMWLLDPARGPERRAQLASRAEGLKRDIGKATDRSDASDDATNASWGTTSGALAATASGTSRSDFGEGYREGFGQPVADPTLPGAMVDDPIRPEEVQEFGSSGPVAGAARAWSADDDEGDARR